MTWSGIGIVGISGVGAILAPEAAPVEIEGGIDGAALIEEGSGLSTVGNTLRAYANGGWTAAGKTFSAGLVLGQINSFVGGKVGSALGLSASSTKGVGGLLDQSAERVLAVQAACDGN